MLLRARFRLSSCIAGPLPSRKGIACEGAVTEARAPAAAALRAFAGQPPRPVGRVDGGHRRPPASWHNRRPVQSPVRRHFRSRRTLSISEGRSTPLPSGQDLRSGFAILLLRRRSRGLAARCQRQHPPFGGHRHQPRTAGSGFRTLGTFGTHRPFPSLARIAARVAASIGRIDHHPRFRRGQDYCRAQPREARQAMSLVRPAHPCERTERAPRAPGGAESRHGALCTRLFPPVMERWIV